MNSAKVKAYLANSPPSKQIYLDIAPSSGVYTPLGIFLEKFKLVELPELLHALIGDLTLVGNRALPLDIQNELKSIHPNAYDRVLIPAGIFGPIQTIGRSNFTDEERLQMEISYCEDQLENYNLTKDIKIIFKTFVNIFSGPTR